MLRVSAELGRLAKNKERRLQREQNKKLQDGGSARSPDGPAAEKPVTGTTRKCANCGQVGHIKTNKKYGESRPISHPCPYALPPFPIVSFYDVVAGGDFDMKRKLLPVLPVVDVAKVFHDRYHGRWRPKFKVKDKMAQAIRDRKRQLSEQRKRQREQEAQLRVMRPMTHQADLASWLSVARFLP